MASGNRQVDSAIGKRGRPPEPPADDARAPLGWTWDSTKAEWRPKKRRGRPAGTSRVSRAGQSVQDAETAPLPDVEPDPEPAGWQAERDPDPAHLRTDRRRPQLRIAPSAEARGEVAGMLGMVGSLVLPVMVGLDPICGTAVANAWPKIAESSLPLLCRSQTVLRFATAGGGMSDWWALGVALMPVAGAIMQHHVFKTVRLADAGEQAPGNFDEFPAAA